MKIILLSVCMLMVGLVPLKAQITITQADLPAVNDTLRYSKANTLSAYDFQQTGEDFSWDFPDLIFQPQGLEDDKSVSSIFFLLGMFFGLGTMALSITDFRPLDDFDLEVEDLPFSIKMLSNTPRMVILPPMCRSTALRLKYHPSVPACIL